VERRLHRRRRLAEEPHEREGERDDGDDERGRADPGDAGAYLNPILFGGQYTKKTSPMRFFRGTAPHVRESHDWFRLSPMKK
jgi:hypothetical protein